MYLTNSLIGKLTKQHFFINSLTLSCHNTFYNTIFLRTKIAFRCLNEHEEHRILATLIITIIFQVTRMSIVIYLLKVFTSFYLFYLEQKHYQQLLKVHSWDYPSDAWWSISNYARFRIHGWRVWFTEGMMMIPVYESIFVVLRNYF